jgi:hypothetical protein
MLLKSHEQDKKNSYAIAIRSWTVLFSPYLHTTPQGMHKKYGEFRVIFDSSTQTIPNKVDLNHIMTTELKAIINFGQAKMKLFTNIYNW